MEKLHTFGKRCPFELVGCSKTDQEICLDQSRALVIQRFLKVCKVGNRIGCDSNFFPANCFFPPSFTQNVPNTYVPRVQSVFRGDTL